MKFRLLFFYSVSIICVINFTSLFSEDITENIIKDMDTEIKPGGETSVSIVLFIGAVCKYFEEGYTVDEIIEIFCKQRLSRDSVEIVVRSFDRILKQDATVKRIPYDGIRFVVRTIPDDYTDMLEEASNRLKKSLEEYRTSVSDDA